jgi:hypothetical protein
MNSEIHSIVEDMKNRCRKDPRNNPSDINNYQIAQMAHLLSLLSEKAETQSEKISKQTDTLINFTRAIVWFTVALMVIGAVQIALMIFKA